MKLNWKNNKWKQQIHTHIYREPGQILASLSIVSIVIFMNGILRLKTQWSLHKIKHRPLTFCNFLNMWFNVSVVIVVFHLLFFQLSFMNLIFQCYKKYCTMLHLFDDLWFDKIIPKNTRVTAFREPLRTYERHTKGIEDHPVQSYLLGHSRYA
jgi:hypothetical protein